MPVDLRNEKQTTIFKKDVFFYNFYSYNECPSIKNLYMFPIDFKKLRIREICAQKILMSLNFFFFLNSHKNLS